MKKKRKGIFVIFLWDVVMHGEQTQGRRDDGSPRPPLSFTHFR